MNKINKKIILEALRRGIKSHVDFIHLKQQTAAAKGAPPPSTSALRKTYLNLTKNNQIKPDEQLDKLLVRRAVRTLSGVAVITVLTKPYPCPGKCIYCPTEAGMPKSYLKNEPAAARAYKLRFDPYRQIITRLEALENNGHPTDKIELIVKGGTWSAYARAYREWFVKRCFDACNLKFKTVGFPKPYSRLVDAQKKNETAKHRIIGFTVETRPDFITPKEIEHLRFLGCTRVELGAQTIDDKILKKIHRGHNTASIINATKLLKDAGFKVDYHIMPNLPGATPKKDLEVFKKIFSDQDFRPDMIKIYPCTVIPGSALYHIWQKGDYKPYSDKALIELLLKVKVATPPYARISRLIRDIPSPSIAAGNKITNLREYLQKELKRRGLRCKCLRCREVGHQKNPSLTLPFTKGEDQKSPSFKKGGRGRILKPKLFVKKYRASGGDEYFISFEDSRHRVVYAFLRLRLLSNGLAFIREVHTYGQMIALEHKNIETSKQTSKQVQHTGFGKQMMAEAERLAKKSGYKKIAVISGVGVRGYYRRLGYGLRNTYMVKKL
jgi:elongator complex protein 3